MKRASKLTAAIPTALQGLLLLWLMAMTAQAASQMYFVHTDHLGTPQVLTDANQNVVWEGQQTPFGELVNEQGTTTQPLRFPGQYADPETGFSYNYYRDYDPTIGRYIQSDPIGLRGGLNTFGYVGANPLYWVDRLGLEYLGIPDNDTNYNPSWQSQIDNAYSQVGSGISEGWMYSPPIAVGAGEGVFGLASLVKFCGSKVKGGVQQLRNWLLSRNLVDPSTIRFTQNSISNVFRNGRTLRSLIEDLKAGRVTANDLPPIRTFERNGNVFTLDNRRLKAFQEAGIQIRTVPATADEIANEAYKLTSKNGGVSILVRGGGL